MATKARPGGAHEAPPGRPADGGLSEADIPTPPTGVLVQAPSEAPPTRQVQSGPGSLAFGEVNSEEIVAQEGAVGDGAASDGVTQPVTSLAPPFGNPRGPGAPAQALDDGSREWEEVGTAAWDPAAVWDAEDKNELWVKGLGWGAPSEASMWQAQPPSTAGPAVRVGWSAAGWSSAPPLTSSDGPDARARATRRRPPSSMISPSPTAACRTGTIAMPPPSAMTRRAETSPQSPLEGACHGANW